MKPNNTHTREEKSVQETYICNGKYFHSWEEVVNYAKSINCRISNTQTIGSKKYLITLSGLSW